MHKTWSKEDRESFSKSEVMKELESNILDTIRRADILIQKQSADAESLNSAAKAAEGLKSQLSEATEAAKGLGEALNSSADDDETAEDGLEDEVLEDLKLLAKAALEEGNLKLAYRIERTIDEIMEPEVLCI